MEDQTNMSTVAPPRSRAFMSSPLRIRRLSFSKGKATPINDQPIIPIKSPKRPTFAPLEPVRLKDVPNYSQKALPPPQSSISISSQKMMKGTRSQNSTFPPLHTPTRSNTRLSATSTAVNSQNSAEATPSPELPAPTSTGGGIPQARIEPQSASLRRTRTSDHASRSSTDLPTRPSMDGGRLSSKPSLSTRNRLAQQANVPPPSAAGQMTPGQKIKDGAFFALVLLPLSCWYTRGGKRLKDLEMKELEDENARRRGVDNSIDSRGRSIATPSMESVRGRSVDETRRVGPGTRDGIRASVDRTRPPTRGVDQPLPRVRVDDARRARAGTLERGAPVKVSMEILGRPSAESAGVIVEGPKGRGRGGSLMRDDGGAGLPLRRRRTNSLAPREVPV